MRVLVLGGHGYLGGRVAQYLNSLGFHVTLGSRNPDVKDCLLSGINTIKIDWNDIDRYTFECDSIIHAAGLNRDDCIEDPESALKFAESTKKLIDVAIKIKIKRFVYLSTAHVYKNPLVGHVKEEMPLTSNHPYAKMHQSSESFVRKASKEGLIEGVIMRLSNVIGPPNQKDVNCWQLLANDLCKQATLTTEILLNSDGKQERNFLPMSDFVRAVAHFIETPYAELSDGIFNVGSEKNITIFSMAELVAKRARIQFGKSIKIRRNKDNRNDNLVSLIFDINKLKNSGFKFIGKLEKEIDETLIFCQENF